MREPASNMARLARTFAPQTMTYTATKAQIWHEMQRTREREGGHVMFWLKKDPENSVRLCSRCNCELKESHGKYPIKLKTMPIFNYDCYLFLWREK